MEVLPLPDRPNHTHTSTYTPCDYATARDLFEAARVAARDADEIMRKLALLESACSVRAQSYQQRISVGSQRDVMAPVDRYVEQEGRYARRLDEDNHLISVASAVLYGGADHTGGIASLLGGAYADVMWWRYCAGASWAEVARQCDRSERWCRDAVPVALDTAESYGWRRVVDGIGTAEQ